MRRRCWPSWRDAGARGGRFDGRHDHPGPRHQSPVAVPLGVLHHVDHRGPRRGCADGEALTALLRPVATSREEAIAASLEGSRVISSPGFPFDVDLMTRRAEAAYDRSYCPEGTARQLGAILGSPDRTPGLGAVTIPFLVIHGEADPLVTVSGGKATAAAVPGSKLIVIPGMGHDLPKRSGPRSSTPSWPTHSWPPSEVSAGGAVRLFVQGVRRHNRRQPGRARFGRAGERGPVDADQAEARPVAEGPLEVVEQ